MSSSSQTDLIDRYLAAYNAFDIEGMLETLAPGVRFENYSGGEMNDAANGVDEFRQLAEQSRTLFSEREQRVTAFEQGEASVMASIAFRGRISTDIPDGPQAGTVLDLHGTSEFTFENGRINKIVDRS